MQLSNGSSLFLLFTLRPGVIWFPSPCYFQTKYYSPRCRLNNNYGLSSDVLIPAHSSCILRRRCYLHRGSHRNWSVNYTSGSNINSLWSHSGPANAPFNKPLSINSPLLNIRSMNNKAPMFNELISEKQDRLPPPN